VFTLGYLARLLADAGWSRVNATKHGRTYSGIAGITDLDSRPDESLFVEARA
jgi:hypothetical protein